METYYWIHHLLLDSPSPRLLIFGNDSLSELHTVMAPWLSCCIIALLFHRSLSGCEWARWPLIAWENHPRCPFGITLKCSMLTPQAHTHSNPYICPAVTLLIHKQSICLDACERCNIANRLSINNLCPFEFLCPRENADLLCWTALPWLWRWYVKTARLFFSFSLPFYLYCAFCQSFPDRPHPHLGPYMSGQQKKRGSF